MCSAWSAYGSWETNNVSVGDGILDGQWIIGEMKEGECWGQKIHPGNGMIWNKRNRGRIYQNEVWMAKLHGNLCCNPRKHLTKWENRMHVWCFKRNAPKGSEAVGKCGFVGVRVASLEEVLLWVSLEIFTQTCSVSHSNYLLLSVRCRSLCWEIFSSTVCGCKLSCSPPW